ncbi:MAG: hypothetical protein LBN27_06330 [Prevotellaceae bacterium]|nr:hypothetical protein [Prevotellaceae bacterium]
MFYQLPLGLTNGITIVIPVIAGLVTERSRSMTRNPLSFRNRQLKLTAIHIIKSVETDYPDWRKQSVSTDLFISIAVGFNQRHKQQHNLSFLFVAKIECG